METTARPEAPQRPLTPERFRPAARTAYYAARGARQRVRARVPLRLAANAGPPLFLIGCGRSGTTLLGELFGMHPGVRYLYEPYDLWAGIQPVTDFLQLYARGEHHCLLDASSVTDRARRRFRRLMSAPRGKTLIEKSPINAMRVGYLDALAPDARFVHITRDGIDVARSIERVAAVTKRMAFRPPLNDWWGVGDVKWAALERDGRAACYYPHELERLTTDAQRGAYEWLVSLREVAAWRAWLGPRLYEFRYADLTDRPRETLQAVMTWVGLPCPAEWLEPAADRVSPARSWQGEPLILPEEMCADFNSHQESFGFGGRAAADRSALPTAPTAADRHGPAPSRRPAPDPAPHRMVRPPAGIHVATVTSLPEALTMKAEWAELAETAGARNPFCHPDWLLPWAERFLRPGEQVWLLAARRNGRLVGVAPFYRRAWGRGLGRSVQLWGTGRHGDLIELPQLLLDPEHARPAARALVARLCAEASAWDWATIPLENPLWIEPEWLPRDGQLTILTKTVRASVILPLSPGKAPTLKRNVRESLRRARNRLDRRYPGGWSVVRATKPADLTAALADLTALHAERSRIAGKKRHPNVLRHQADRSFLSAGLTAAAAREGACIYRLLAGGEAIAALLVLRSRDTSYILISGMSQRAWEFSPTTLLQGHAIEDAVTLGQSRVNLSAGPDTAKLRWSEDLALSSEFVLSPSRLRSNAVFWAYWQAAAAAELIRERRRHQPLS
jgi:CelD/BcsL family acetyltransferase involved in cellulose biosynthesis